MQTFLTKQGIYSKPFFSSSYFRMKLDALTFFPNTSVRLQSWSVRSRTHTNKGETLYSCATVKILVDRRLNTRGRWRRPCGFDGCSVRTRRDREERLLKESRLSRRLRKNHFIMTKRLAGSPDLERWNFTLKSGYL